MTLEGEKIQQGPALLTWPDNGAWRKVPLSYSDPYENASSLTQLGMTLTKTGAVSCAL